MKYLFKKKICFSSNIRKAKLFLNMFSFKQLALVMFTTLPYRQYNFFVDHRKTLYIFFMLSKHFKLFTSNNSFVIWNRSFIRGYITVRCAFGYFSFAPKGNRTKCYSLVRVQPGISN